MDKKIKTLSIYLAPAGEEEGIIRLYRVFDPSGKVATETHYDKEGEEAFHHEYTYNPKGQEVAEKTSYDEERWEIKRSHFDELGRLTNTWVEYPDGQKTDEKEYHWNEAGDTLTVKIKNEDGDIASTEIHIYNDNKDLIEEKFLDAENELLERYTYDYGDNKLLVRKVGHFDGFETEEHLNYEFDNEGRMTKMVRSDEEDVLESLEISYHENGKKASESRTGPDGANISFKYDKQEKVSRETRKDQTGYRIFEAANMYNGNDDLEERHVVNDGRLSVVMYEYSYFGGDEEE